MKPAQPIANSQLPPSPQTRQQTALKIDIDNDSTTESESDQLDGSPLESDPDDYYSAQRRGLLPPENQLGLEEWEIQYRRLHCIPEVPEPTGESQLFEGTCPTLRYNLDKIDRGVQVSQDEPVRKDDNIPVDAEKHELFLDGHVSLFLSIL